MAHNIIPPSQEVLDAAALVRKRIRSIPKVRGCERCDGEGVRNDIENWVVIPASDASGSPGGKVCFRCGGSGRAPDLVFADPMVVRKAVGFEVKKILESPEPLIAVTRAARREHYRHMYWPVLIDVFNKGIYQALYLSDDVTKEALADELSSLHELMFL